MPEFVRKILIFVTGYAWLLLLAGPGLIALSVYSGWKAEDGHAYVARDSLQTVSGTVTQAAEVTVKRKRRSTKHYYEISVQPDTAGAEVRKLRIDYSTPQQLVGNLIDEKVTALVDSSDHDLVYEVLAQPSSATTPPNSACRPKPPPPRNPSAAQAPGSSPSC